MYESLSYSFKRYWFVINRILGQNYGLKSTSNLFHLLFHLFFLPFNYFIYYVFFFSTQFEQNLDHHPFFQFYTIQPYFIESISTHIFASPSPSEFSYVSAPFLSKRYPNFRQNYRKYPLNLLNYMSDFLF